MNDLNVIDQFMDSFVRYIDSGFGLLGGDVGFLTTVLIGIDITLAGLFWALGGEDDVIGTVPQEDPLCRRLRADPEQLLDPADIIFRSFAGLGLTAGGGTSPPTICFGPGGSPAPASRRPSPCSIRRASWSARSPSSPISSRSPC